MSLSSEQLVPVLSSRAPSVPVVAFVSQGDAARSLIAAGWFEHLAGDRAIGISGGNNPSSRIRRPVVKAMDEVGISLRGRRQGFVELGLAEYADVVVTIGLGRPDVRGRRYEYWDLPAPLCRRRAQVRPLRDELERRVRQLLRSLEVPMANALALEGAITRNAGQGPIS